VNLTAVTITSGNMAERGSTGVHDSIGEQASGLAPFRLTPGSRSTRNWRALQRAVPDF